MYKKIKTMAEYCLAALLVFMTLEAFSKLSIYRLALVCAIGVGCIVRDMCMLKNLTPTLTFGLLGCIACIIGPRNNPLEFFTIWFLEGYFIKKQCVENQREPQNNNVFNAPNERNNPERPAQTVVRPVVQEQQTRVTNLERNRNRDAEIAELKQWRLTARI